MVSVIALMGFRISPSFWDCPWGITMSLSPVGVAGTLGFRNVLSSSKHSFCAAL